MTPWHAAPEPQRLIEAILTERPHATDTHKLPAIYGGYTERHAPRYQGKNALALRRYHAALLDEALRRDDNDYRLTGVMGGRFAELVEVTPDALISRLLAEPIALPPELKRTGTHGGYWL